MGKYFESSAQVLHIGRLEHHNDFVLDDSCVSHQHARIVRDGDRYIVYDHGSTSGTSIVRKKERIRLDSSNEHRVVLVSGDTIEFGTVAVRITLSGDPKGRTAGSLAMRRAPLDIKDMLAEWRARAEVYSREHQRVAVRLERRHYWLGIPSTMMGAIVGTAIFGSIEKAASSFWLKAVLAAASMGAACLVALQTFLRYLERAGQHNLAHAEYEDIARSLELLSMTEKSREDWVKCLEGFSQRLEAIKGRAPLPFNVDMLEREVEELSNKLRSKVRASVKKKLVQREDDSLSDILEGFDRGRESEPPRMRGSPALPSKPSTNGAPPPPESGASFVRQLRDFEAAPPSEDG
ncbi:SLATT domain-containing protein [Pendulispora albinea]|uniref:SLATT domain-containing protein n=2 Tax=Pendulispora albinea TaxID=2741071 RepID=A0ABZ2M2M7_9BACT